MLRLVYIVFLNTKISVPELAINLIYDLTRERKKKKKERKRNTEGGQSKEISTKKKQVTKISVQYRASASLTLGYGKNFQ